MTLYANVGVVGGIFNNIEVTRMAAYH